MHTESKLRRPKSDMFEDHNVQLQEITPLLNRAQIVCEDGFVAEGRCPGDEPVELWRVYWGIATRNLLDECGVATDWGLASAEYTSGL